VTRDLSEAGALLETPAGIGKERESTNSSIGISCGVGTQCLSTTRLVLVSRGVGVKGSDSASSVIVTRRYAHKCLDAQGYVCLSRASRHTNYRNSGKLKVSTGVDIARHIQFSSRGRRPDANIPARLK